MLLPSAAEPDDNVTATDRDTSAGEFQVGGRPEGVLPGRELDVGDLVQH
jgi:hypothetical protein